MEREQLYAMLAGKNVIVLAGDTHNAWLGKLTNAQGNFIGTELACSSVSSPGLEGYLGITSDPAQAIELANAFSLLIDDLDYANLYKRGYLHVKFTSGNSVAEWRFVDNVISDTYAVTTEKHTPFHSFNIHILFSIFVAKSISVPLRLFFISVIFLILIRCRRI